MNARKATKETFEKLYKCNNTKEAHRFHSNSIQLYCPACGCTVTEIHREANDGNISRNK